MLDKRVQISSDRERSNGMANIDIVDRITWKIKEQKFSNKRKMNEGVQRYKKWRILT